MKKIYTILSILSLMLFCSSGLFAVKPVKNTPAPIEASKELSEKEAKKLQKFEKRINKRLEKMNKNADVEIDFDDPVDKWMWFWIFAWGLGLALGLLQILVSIGFLGFLSYALFVFGFVAMVLWIVKKFS